MAQQPRQLLLGMQKYTSLFSCTSCRWTGVSQLPHWFLHQLLQRELWRKVGAVCFAGSRWTSCHQLTVASTEGNKTLSPSLTWPHPSFSQHQTPSEWIFAPLTLALRHPYHEKYTNTVKLSQNTKMWKPVKYTSYSCIQNAHCDINEFNHHWTLVMECCCLYAGSQMAVPWKNSTIILLSYHKIQNMTSRLMQFILQTAHYTMSWKTVQNCFCQNFVKFPPIMIIFSRKMAKRQKLCMMHSFSTSSNLCCHTTALNADVPNCDKMLL